MGLLFVLIGPSWIGLWSWWDSTRIWVPLDVPISLAPGHIRTPEFRVNVASTYSLGVAVKFPSNDDYDAVWRMLGLDQFDNTPSVVGVSWRLSSEGRPVAGGNSDTALGGMHPWTSRALGYFLAAKGKYVLDLDVVRDGSRLNDWAPHLIVVENGNEHEKQDARGNRGALLILLFPVGLVMLVRAANGRRAERRNAWLRAWPLTQPSPQLQAAGQEALEVAPSRVYSAAVIPRQRKTRPMRPAFTRPAWIGLVMLLCYVVIDIPVWAFFYGTRLVPKGLPVRLMNRALRDQQVPGIQPLLVRLAIGGCDAPHPHERRGPQPCLQIDTQAVSWDDFDSVLHAKLLLRPPNWPVYVEGDRAMEWRYAAEVIDRIEGLHAKVVLLGSRTP